MTDQEQIKEEAESQDETITNSEEISEDIEISNENSEENVDEIISDSEDDSTKNKEDNTENKTLDKDGDKKDSENLEDHPEWVKKRLARQERKHQRELRDLQETVNNQKLQTESLMTPEQLEEYNKQLETQQMQQFQVHEMAKEQKFVEGFNVAREKYEDFEESLSDPDIMGNFTDEMVIAAKNSPNGADLIYHLSKNKKEVKRISRLPVDQQVRAMYMAEAAMSNAVKAVKSSAPPPMDQTRAIPKSKTSDPTKMDYSQVLEARRKQMIEKYGDR